MSTPFIVVDMKLPAGVTVPAGTRRRGADLTQTGERRQIAPVDKYLALPDQLVSAPFVWSATVPNTVVGITLPGTGLRAGAMTVVQVTMDWQAAATAAHVVAAQTALRPSVAVNNAAIQGDPAVQAKLAEYMEQARTNAMVVASRISANVDEKHSMYAFLHGLPGGATAGVAVSPAQVLAADVASLYAVSMAIPVAEKKAMVAATQLIVEAARRAGTVPANRNSCEEFSDVWETTRLRLQARAYVAPAFFLGEYIDADGNAVGDPFEYCTVEVRQRPTDPVYDVVEDKGDGKGHRQTEINRLAAIAAVAGMPDVAVPVPDADAAVIAEYLYYQMTVASVLSGTDEQKHRLATSRCYGCRYNFYSMSNEVARGGTVVNIALTGPTTAMFNAYLDNPNEADIALTMAVISFMESGHHATASGLSSKCAKVSAAVGVNMDMLKWESVMSHAVYVGSHPFSVLLMRSRLEQIASRGVLSMAVAYRLNKPAPTTAAYYQLDIVVRALKNAHFFDLMGKEAELKEFEAAFEDIARNNWMKAPYSQYLYGVSAVCSEISKAKCAQLAAYAHEIKETMPGSTLSSAPALTKIAKAAASSSISAHLEVRAYVHAYKDVIDRMVKLRMTPRAAATSAPALALPGLD